MILILEPFEELLDIDFRKEKFNDKNTTNALIKLYKKLLNIPEYFYKSIDELIIINSLAASFHISDKSFRDSIKIITKNKIQNEIKILFSNAHLVEIKDNTESSLFINSLIRKYDKATFIIFDTLLTPPMPSFLSVCNHLIGFRFIKKENGIWEWEKIENIQKYIAIGFVLFYRQFNVDEVDNNMVTYSRDYQISIIKEILRSIRSGLSNQHMMLFRKSEMEDQNFVLGKLMDELGYFGIHNCRVDGLQLNPNDERYIIYGLEKIDDQSRYKFLNTISSERFKDKVIFIIVEHSLDLTEFPKIKFWLELREDNSRANSEIVMDNLKNANRIFNRKMNEYKYLMKNILTDDRLEKRFVKKLDKLMDLNPNKYDIEKINFWYDLDSMEIDEIENWQKPISGMIRTVKRLDDAVVTNYEIMHNKDKNIWEIKIDGDIVVNDLTYKACLGMKFLVYLCSYYQQKAIDVKSLRDVIYKWHKKEYTYISREEDARTISGVLSYFFEDQCGKLSELSKFIKITPKSPGCFFQNQKNIALKIFDEDMPAPS